MKRDPNEDARAQGGIDLPLIQRFVNHWFSESLDLFGSPDSSNAAASFGAGLKGRYQESRPGHYHDDHRLLGGTHAIERPGARGEIEHADVPLRRAGNALLLEAYVRECEKSVARWNGVLSAAGLGARLSLPSPRFNRKIGPFAESHWLPDGSTAAGREAVAARLPLASDFAWLEAVEGQRVREPGRVASWIAPPSQRIHDRPLDFAYVRFA